MLGIQGPFAQSNGEGGSSAIKYRMKRGSALIGPRQTSSNVRRTNDEHSNGTLLLLVKLVKIFPVTQCLWTYSRSPINFSKWNFSLGLLC